MNNNRPAVGDLVNVMLYGYAETATIEAITEDGKMVLVRHDRYTPARVFTLRAGGKYVIKGKKATTSNAAHLDLTASGL